MKGFLEFKQHLKEVLLNSNLPKDIEELIEESERGTVAKHEFLAKLLENETAIILSSDIITVFYAVLYCRCINGENTYDNSDLDKSQLLMNKRVTSIIYYKGNNYLDCLTQIIDIKYNTKFFKYFFLLFYSFALNNIQENTMEKLIDILKKLNNLSNSELYYQFFTWWTDNKEELSSMGFTRIAPIGTICQYTLDNYKNDKFQSLMSLNNITL